MLISKYFKPDCVVCWAAIVSKPNAFAASPKGLSLSGKCLSSLNITNEFSFSSLGFFIFR